MTRLHAFSVSYLDRVHVENSTIFQRIADLTTDHEQFLHVETNILDNAFAELELLLSLVTASY